MDKKYTVLFDTETTGLINPSARGLDQQPEIIELYMCKIDEGFNMIEELDTFLKPKFPISKRITEITGIDDNIVKNAPVFVDIYKDLTKFMTGTDRLVAHNLNFDRNMLANELLRIDKVLMFPWPREHVCTVQKSMGIEQRRISLAKLHKYATGKEFNGAHRAKADVMALVRSYHYLVEKGLIEL